MRISFSEVGHIYRLNGIRVPNVTAVLRDLYSWDLIPLHVIARRRQIGIAVHEAIALDVYDGLDEASLDPQIANYFAAWRRFRREQAFHCAYSETRVASERYRYAGTFDLVGTMAGTQALIDTKNTNYLHAASALQTAAYAQAAQEMGLVSDGIRRYTLYLREDGSYRLDSHRESNDLAIFLSCLSRYNWAVRRRLIKDMIHD